MRNPSSSPLPPLLRSLLLAPLSGALLLGLLAGCSAAPAPAAPAATVTAVEVPQALDAELPVDPTIRTGTLENGLTYYVRRNGAPENRAELWLVVNAGSILEDQDQRGLAHFIEHMAFNGTRRFAEQELVDYLESIGMRFGPDINAYTSFDETVYLLRVPTDRRGFLDRGLEILEDWAQGITLDPGEIDSERGVMIEEWRLGRGAEGRLIDAQIPVLFAGSRYAERLPIGSREVLETSPRAALERFYRDWYRPDLMAVIAVGDFDPERVERRVRERFSGLEAPPEPRERDLFEVPGHDETLFATFTDPELTVTTVSVYTKLPKRPDGTVGDYRRGLVEHLYHGMINDRLYEAGHRPDPPYLWALSETESLVRTADVDQQEAGVPEGGVTAGLEALLVEIERVRRHGFTEGELARAKRTLLRAYERAWVQRANRSSGSYAAEYSRNFLQGEPIPGLPAELELVTRFLPGIELEELDAMAGARAGAEDRVILVSGPEEAADGLPSEEELLAVFERVAERPIEPYRDLAPDTPLLAEVPEPGEIVERRRLPRIGVSEWELSNGVRVVLKPTDFREDQVMLDGFSPGGHSLVPDDEHLTASYAAEIVALGGLGEHDEIALGKLLAGEVAQVGPYIEELEEGVEAFASSEDLETLFQLVHLALTEPRLDLEAVRSYQDRLRPLLENRLADPEQVFVERMLLLLTGDHPRRQPLTPDRLEAIDPERALDIYRERYADAGDFTFVVVGAFDLEEIEPLVATYLGSLPATGRDETWRDVGVERPEGPRELVVRRGIEPKAQVWIQLGRPAEVDRETRHGLGALAEALEIRLREVLREDLGAVYGVDVGAEAVWRPRERVGLSIQLGCDPARAEELASVIGEEIGRFRGGRVPPEVAEKVRQILRRQRELALRDNGYWLDALGAAYRRGEDPEAILDADELIAAISAESLAETARRYLDWDRRIVGLLLPAERDGDATEER